MKIDSYIIVFAKPYILEVLDFSEEVVGLSSIKNWSS